MVIELPDTNIPPNSKVRIEALPQRHLVWEGMATKSVSRNFDIGKYLFVITRIETEDGSIITNRRGEFLVGCTEEQWQKLQYKRPKLSHLRITSDGTTWTCGFMGCRNLSSSMMGALEHEYTHYAVNLLEDLDKDEKIQAAASQVMATTRTQHQADADAKASRTPEQAGGGDRSEGRPNLTGRQFVG